MRVRRFVIASIVERLQADDVPRCHWVREIQVKLASSGARAVPGAGAKALQRGRTQIRQDLVAMGIWRTDK